MSWLPPGACVLNNTISLTHQESQSQNVLRTTQPAWPASCWELSGGLHPDGFAGGESLVAMPLSAPEFRAEDLGSLPTQSHALGLPVGLGVSEPHPPPLSPGAQGPDWVTAGPSLG